jgi:hypothetical protein
MFPKIKGFILNSIEQQWLSLFCEELLSVNIDSEDEVKDLRRSQDTDADS